MDLYIRTMNAEHQSSSEIFTARLKTTDICSQLSKRAETLTSSALLNTSPRMSASRTLTIIAAAFGLARAQTQVEFQPGWSTDFEPLFDPYNTSFCADRSQVVDPTPAMMLFPFTAEQMYDVVGNFSDPSWQGLHVTGHVGAYNIPGEELDMDNEPLDHREILDRYALNTKTFAHQQVSHTIPPVAFPYDTVPAFAGAGPNYTIQASHNVLSIVPACGGQATLLNLTVAYCMGGSPVPGSNFSLASLVSGDRATPALQGLWTRVQSGLPAPDSAQKTFSQSLTCKSLNSTQA